MIAQRAEPKPGEDPDVARRELDRSPLLPPPQRDQDRQRAEAPGDGHFDCGERAERILLGDDRAAPHDRGRDERGVGGELRGFDGGSSGVGRNVRAIQAGVETSSMRCRAMRAQYFSSSGTEIWLTTWPSARFSIAQQRGGASIRDMVADWHTVGDREE